MADVTDSPPLAAWLNIYNAATQALSFDVETLSEVVCSNPERCQHLERTCLLTIVKGKPFVLRSMCGCLICSAARAGMSTRGGWSKWQVVHGLPTDERLRVPHAVVHLPPRPLA